MSLHKIPDLIVYQLINLKTVFVSEELRLDNSTPILVYKVSRGRTSNYEESWEFTRNSKPHGSLIQFGTVCTSCYSVQYPDV